MYLIFKFTFCVKIDKAPLSVKIKTTICKQHSCQEAIRKIETCSKIGWKCSPGRPRRNLQSTNPAPVQHKLLISQINLLPFVPGQLHLFQEGLGTANSAHHILINHNDYNEIIWVIRNGSCTMVKLFCSKL